MAEAAEVVELIKSEGQKGLSLVKCKLLEGSKKDRTFTRVVIGKVKIGEVIYLPETEMEGVSM